MPKLELVSRNHYRYNCKCGTELDLFTDEKPKRVPRCWECLEKNVYDLYSGEVEFENKKSSHKTC